MSEYNGVLYAAPAPAGVIPNFDNPHNAGGLIASIGVLAPLAIIFTSLRAYTRIVMTRQHGWDDAIMSLATILNIVMCIIVIDMLRYGMGKHIWDVPLAKLYPHFMLENIIIAMIFCAASAMSKLSILLMYLRIFPHKSGFRTAVVIASAFVTGFGLATVLTNLLSCKPISGSWELKYATTAKCIDRPAFYLAQAALGIAVDIATVVIPIPAIRKLYMDTTKKVGVMLLLSMGAFVCIVSMIRLKSLVDLFGTADLTRVTPNALMWCIIELNVSIIGGCIPAIKPLLKRYLPFLVSRSAYTRSKPVSGEVPKSTATQNSLQNGRKSIPLVSVRPTDSSKAETDSVEELVQVNNMAPKEHEKEWRFQP